MQSDQPVIARPTQGKRKHPIPPAANQSNQLDQSTGAQQGHNHQASVQDSLVNQSIAGQTETTPKAADLVRTLQMRYYAFAELGLLFLIFILSIVSLSIPSVLMSRDMLPADQISQGLGIPSILLVFSLAVRLVVFCLVRWIFREGLVERICLWVAAGLWTLATGIHILIAIGISAKNGEAYINAGLPLAIVVAFLQVVSVIVGKRAIQRLTMPYSALKVS